MKSLKYLEKSNIFKIWSRLVLKDSFDDSVLNLSKIFTSIYGQELIYYRFYYPILIPHKRMHIELYVTRGSTNRYPEYSYLISSTIDSRDLDITYGRIFFDVLDNSHDYKIKMSSYLQGEIKIGSEICKKLDSKIMTVIKESEKLMSMFLNFGCWVSSKGFFDEYCNN